MVFYHIRLLFHIIAGSIKSIYYIFIRIDYTMENGHRWNRSGLCKESFDGYTPLPFFQAGTERAFLEPFECGLGEFYKHGREYAYEENGYRCYSEGYAVCKRCSKRNFDFRVSHVHIHDDP